jgi:hypothetical protein
VWWPHYYVLSYVLVFSMILTLGVFGFILYEQILFGFNGCWCLIYIFLDLWFYSIIKTTHLIIHIYESGVAIYIWNQPKFHSNRLTYNNYVQMWQ